MDAFVADASVAASATVVGVVAVVFALATFGVCASRAAVRFPELEKAVAISGAEKSSKLSKLLNNSPCSSCEVVASAFFEGELAVPVRLERYCE